MAIRPEFSSSRSLPLYSLVGTGHVQAPCQHLVTYSEPAFRVLSGDLAAGYGEGHFFGDEQFAR